MLTIPVQDELVLRVQSDLGDPEGNRYDPATIKSLFDRGQYEFVKRTKCLRARKAITSRENRAVYNFPGDMIDPLRLEDEDGNKIDFVTAEWLQEHVGNDFRSRTGTSSPEYAYSDYAGKGKFELYPRPSPTIEKAPLTPNNGYLRIAVNEPSGVSFLSIHVHKRTLYAFSSTQVFYYDIELDGSLTLGKTVTTGFTLASSTFPAIVWEGFTTYTNSQNGMLIFADAADIYYIKPGETSATLLHTAAGVVSFILPSGVGSNALNDPLNLLWVDAASATTLRFYDFSTDLDGDIGAIISGLSQAAVGPNGTDIYIGGSGGAQIIDVTGVTINAAFTANDINSIFTLGTSVYYWSDTVDKIVKITIADNVANNTFANTSVDVTNFNTSSQAFSNGADTFFIVNSTSVLLLENIDLGATNNSYYSIEADNLLTTNFRRQGVGGNHYYVFEVITGSILVSEKNLGTIVNIDDTLFDNELGTITDIKEDNDIINFDRDFGIVHGITANEDVFYLNYVRRPLEGKVEIAEYYALIEYAKYKLREQDDDARSERDVAVYRANFEELVGDDSGKAAHGFNRNRVGSTTYFF